MKNWKRVAVSSNIGDGGGLWVIDDLESSAFSPGRVFWVTNVPAGATRGFHAHKTGRQVLLCLSGRIVAKFDNGKVVEEIELTKDGPGILMENMVWGEQTFVEPGSILLVLASNNYDEQDYIRSRIEFDSLLK